MKRFKRIRLTIQRLFDRLVMWLYSLKHPCYVGGGEYDHDWTYKSDWYGDPEVVGGTADCSYWECQTCGEINTEMPSPEYDPWDDYDLGTRGKW